MTSEPVILAPDATVAEALARVRRAELSPALAAGLRLPRPAGHADRPRTSAWCTSSGCCANRRATLGGIVDNDIDPLAPDATLAEITRRLATYNLVAMPVVDAEDHLVGAVTVDDVLDHLLPRDWRDRTRRRRVVTPRRGSRRG